jgi:hypothetical protein
MRSCRIINAILAIVVSMTCSACSGAQYPQGFSDTPGDSEKKALSPQLFNYSDYLLIKCNPIETIAESYSQTGSTSFDEVRYHIRIENVTQKPIEMRFRVFLDSNFTESFTESADPMFCTGPSETFTLEVGKGFNIDIVDGIMNDKSLDDTQKRKKQIEMGVYDFEFMINGRWTYIRYDSNQSGS